MKALGFLAICWIPMCGFAAADSAKPAAESTTQDFIEQFPAEEFDQLKVIANTATLRIKQGPKFIIHAGAMRKSIQVRKHHETLILDSSGEPNTAIDYEITLPKGVLLKLAGGSLKITLKGLKLSMLSIAAGDVICESRDGLIGRVDIRAGRMAVDLDKVRYTFKASCGQGHTRVAFDMKPPKRFKGLRLKFMPYISLQQAMGEATFIVPAWAKVGLEERNPAVQCAVPTVYKNDKKTRGTEESTWDQRNLSAIIMVPPVGNTVILKSE